jgi:hypothetical protein
MEVWQQILNGVLTLIIEVMEFFSQIFGFSLPDTTGWTIF